MAEIKFCCCSFDGSPSRLIALQAGDSKNEIINAFNIFLCENEDIIVADEISGAIVDTSSLFTLVSSLRCPTDLKFTVQSRFPLKIIAIVSLSS